MPQQSTRVEVNNFIKGLITEASPLNYPANASLDEENFELNRDGTRDRRLGMDYEAGFVRLPSPIPLSIIGDAKFSTYSWFAVAGNLEQDFLVVQAEQVLTFYDLNSASVSGTGPVGVFNLITFPLNTVYSFSSLEGTLVVAAGTETIAIISYEAGVFSVSYERLLVRDVWGVEVTGEPLYETNPAYRGGFDSKHYYNLQNQSWGIPRKDDTNVLVDPIMKYYEDLYKFPSNSETVWTGLQFQPVTGGVTFERMYTNLYTELLGASVSATKGYYVIDALQRGTSRMEKFADNQAQHVVSGTVTLEVNADYSVTSTVVPSTQIKTVDLPLDKTSGGAQIITEFAGRIWYAGFDGTVVDGDSRSPNYSNFIFFSKLVKNKSDFVKCYQEGDPASRDTTDLVDTDGGFIRISGAKKIISMVSIGESLVVIASNGVWHVKGGAEYGFSATNYKVPKISSFGGLSRSSVVEEGGRVFFWSENGIYAIGSDQLGTLTVTNITQTTIQKYYESIDNIAKDGARGIYDPIAKKVRWLYHEGTRFTSGHKTYELVLDTTLSAFYRNRIENTVANNVQVVDLFISLPFQRNSLVSDVHVEAAQALSDLSTIGIGEAIRTSGVQSVKYLVIESSGGIVYTSFSLFNNTEFKDWKSVDTVGVDAKAYLLTGEVTAGDSSISKQVPYLTMHFTKTEDGVTTDLIPNNQSGCLMRCQWDFADSILSKKWSALVQVYRYRRALLITGPSDAYDNGFSVVTTKSKIRGRGKSFSLYLETEPAKDCRILGWNLSLKGNPNV